MLKEIFLNVDAEGTGIATTFDMVTPSPTSRAIIKSISGLSAPDMSLFLGEFARDGGYYQGRRAQKRNVVVLFKLNPQYGNEIVSGGDIITAEDLRSALYKVFMNPWTVGHGVRIDLLSDDKPDRFLVGYTERIEADMFSKEVGAGVTLVCPDPYIWAINAKSATDATGWTSVPLDYEGNAPAGFSITLEVTGTTSQIVLRIDEQWTYDNNEKIVLNGSFVAGDTIVINTAPGSKRITREGVDAMGIMAAGSRWLQMGFGENTFKTYGSAVNDGLVKIMNVSYREAWWGI